MSEEKKKEETKPIISKHKKIVIFAVVICIIVGAGYFGYLAMQSLSTGVAIQDLDKYKENQKKEAEFYNNF